jgi:hypothetical protein
MKLSEEEKKHYREVFEEKNSIIEYSYGIGWIPVKTKDELERILYDDNEAVLDDIFYKFENWFNENYR